MIWKCVLPKGRKWLFLRCFSHLAAKVSSVARGIMLSSSSRVRSPMGRLLSISFTTGSLSKYCTGSHLMPSLAYCGERSECGE